MSLAAWRLCSPHEANISLGAFEPRECFST